MAKFITGTELENAITSIIVEAQDKLIIVSPFIKLDDYFKHVFDKHKENAQLEIVVVFGKNEDDKSRSLNFSDFEYFKSFPNVSIIYEPKLHAKYYGNEKKGIVTSINLYDFSFRNNIEYGIYFENSLLDKFTQTSDTEVWEKSLEVADNGEVVFIKRPVFKKKLISVFGKDYVSSKVLFDDTENFSSRNGKLNGTKKQLPEYPRELSIDDVKSNIVTREEFEKSQAIKKNENSQQTDVRIYNSNHQQWGYCIRSGVKIPFDINMPMSADAFQSWLRFENPDYAERYCHYSGEYSNGETSFRQPILRKNWRAAREHFM